MNKKNASRLITRTKKHQRLSQKSMPNRKFLKMIMETEIYLSIYPPPTTIHLILEQQTRHTHSYTYIQIQIHICTHLFMNREARSISERIQEYKYMRQWAASAIRHSQLFIAYEISDVLCVHNIKDQRTQHVFLP